MSQIFEDKEKYHAVGLVFTRADFPDLEKDFQLRAVEYTDDWPPFEKPENRISLKWLDDDRRVLHV